jgi:POT family proton-dependent oligopeptide transporter
MQPKMKESNIWTSGIIVAAALQRFGHYGMRSLLIVYLATDMKMSGQQAGQIYGLFYGSFFVTSLIGGVLGDSRRGYGWTGSVGLICILTGHVGLWLGGPAITMCALVIYTIGFGLFDPNLSVAVARRYHDERLRDSAYTVLYTSINIGATLGPLLFGYIALRTNARVSFLIGGLWPLLAFLSFNPATKKRIVTNSSQDIKETAGVGSVLHANTKTGKLSGRRWIIIGILGLAGIVFAAVFDQLGSSVTLLANRYVHRGVGSFTLPAGYVQSINPFFVILLGPLFALAMKHKQSSGEASGKAGILSLGMILLGSGFGVLALASSGIGHIGDHNTVKWTWIFLSIFLATVGELLFAPISFSLVAGLSPPGRQAVLMGVWSATYGIGAYLSGTMAGFMETFGTFSLFLGISASACWVAGAVLWTATRALHTGLEGTKQTAQH